MGKDPEKKTYKKVQFLAWEIYTGPIRNNDKDAIGYAGLRLRDAKRRVNQRCDVLAQCIDIEARLEATRRALETAKLWADPDENVLKLFMAPEFLYRGPAGVYLDKLLDGWEGPAPEECGTLCAPFDVDWDGLAGGLRKLAADEKYEDWIFVFGTAIGGRYTEACGDGAAFNRALVQRGGPGHKGDFYRAEQRLKSRNDFVEFNFNHPSVTDGNMVYTLPQNWETINQMVYERDGCLFSFPTVCRENGNRIQFGLETCLDHAMVPMENEARGEDASDRDNVTGRLAIGRELVDIQLVPSCGLSLLESSLALAPSENPRDATSYAFNCDGQGGIKEGGRSLGGHVQLWRAVNAVGEYRVEVLQEVQSAFDEPDQTPPPPDDPTQSRHFGIDNSDIDLSGRIHLNKERQWELRVDLKRIPPCTLWRSHEDFPQGEDPHTEVWPKGLGCIRRLPPVPL